MNILLPRNAVLRTLFPRGRKSGANLPAVFTGIVAEERNFHSIALSFRLFLPCFSMSHMDNILVGKYSEEKADVSKTLYLE
jgi:hypothetical protein